MAVTVTKAGGNTTFTFQIVVESATLDPILEDWAKYVWHHGFGATEIVNGQEQLKPYASATNQEKFSALNKRIKRLGMAEANTQVDTDAQAALTPSDYDLDGVA